MIQGFISHITCTYYVIQSIYISSHKKETPNYYLSKHYIYTLIMGLWKECCCSINFMVSRCYSRHDMGDQFSIFHGEKIPIFTSLKLMVHEKTWRLAKKVIHDIISCNRDWTFFLPSSIPVCEYGNYFDVFMDDFFFLLPTLIFFIAVNKIPPEMSN